MNSCWDIGLWWYCCFYLGRSKGFQLAFNIYRLYWEFEKLKSDILSKWWPHKITTQLLILQGIALLEHFNYIGLTKISLWCAVFAELWLKKNNDNDGCHFKFKYAHHLLFHKRIWTGIPHSFLNRSIVIIRCCCYKKNTIGSCVVW